MTDWDLLLGLWSDSVLENQCNPLYKLGKEELSHGPVSCWRKTFDKTPQIKTL